MLNPIQLEESMGMGMVLPYGRPTAILTLRAFAKATVKILSVRHILSWTPKFISQCLFSIGLCTLISIALVQGVHEIKVL